MGVNTKRLTCRLSQIPPPIMTPTSEAFQDDRRKDKSVSLTPSVEDSSIIIIIIIIIIVMLTL
jgi:hypothetical protein